MKKLFIKITFVIILFQTQIGFSQDVPVKQYAEKMIGKWEVLVMDEDDGLVPDSEHVIYDFIDQTTLKIYRNKKLDDTMKYKLSLAKVSRLHLKSSISKDFNVDYNFYIHYEDSELYMNFESIDSPGVQVLRKKIKK
ncbi:hypothetical protein [Flavobacterium sp. KJJ]|uniref:hypothetical protein n=1 Tax=Flavobacterium sp. KJJ TaxID=1270193 RepID=UPI0004930897|nr:hypothetical protein [Flavobacterium sp. KJJ]